MVKQLVGGTLDDATGTAQTNFVSERPPAWFAARYREDGLRGGHLIKLGPGNEAAAREALSAYPGGLQLGGGVTVENAAPYLEAGASHVIVTSTLFDGEGRLQKRVLNALAAEVGREKLVLDLSCRRAENGWQVAMNRWQTLTELPVSQAVLEDLAEHCAEFLVHAADVEGKCQGIDEALVERLGEWTPIPTTYAGGARSLEDLALVHPFEPGQGRPHHWQRPGSVGGAGARYEDCVRWNERRLLGSGQV